MSTILTPPDKIKSEFDANTFEDYVTLPQHAAAADTVTTYPAALKEKIVWVKQQIAQVQAETAARGERCGFKTLSRHHGVATLKMTTCKDDKCAFCWKQTRLERLTLLLSWLTQLESGLPRSGDVYLVLVSPEVNWDYFQSEYLRGKEYMVFRVRDDGCREVLTLEPIEKYRPRRGEVTTVKMTAADALDKFVPAIQHDARGKDRAMCQSKDCWTYESDEDKEEDADADDDRPETLGFLDIDFSEFFKFLVTKDIPILDAGNGKLAFAAPNRKALLELVLEFSVFSSNRGGKAIRGIRRIARLLVAEYAYEMYQAGDGPPPPSPPDPPNGDTLGTCAAKGVSNAA